MSVGSSTGAIHFSGVASGIDVDTLVTGLTAADQIPINDLKTEQTALQDKQTAYSAIRTALNSFVAAMSALSQTSTFSPIASSVGDSTVASVTTGTGATAGSYNLTVGTLAQAQKVSSAAQNSATNALNMSGEFTIDGKAVQVVSSDSLTSIANKINALSGGTVASVINGGTGQAYLSLAATQTGLVNKIQASDVNGNVLSSLGIIAGAPAVRQAGSTAGTAESYNVSSATAPLSGLMNGVAGSGTVTVNGSPVSIDFGSDSLQTIASKINATNTGMTATVNSSTDSSGNVSYHLELGGTGVPAGISDPNNLMGAIGVTQQPFSHTLVPAQDATYTLDSLSLTSSSNQISGVIPGVTLSLLKANSTTTVNLTRDTSSIVSSVNAVQGAYNGLMDQISQFTAYDASTNTSGALLGDITTQTIAQGITSGLFKSSGSGAFTNLTQIGVTLDQTGKLQVDNTKLTNALTSNLSGVENLLTAAGSTNNANLSYVSSGTKTVSSSGSGYDVNVTSLATQSTYAGSVAQTSPLAASETLTFGGVLFGNSSYALNLNAGMTASDIVNKINADAKLSPLVTASINSSGDLQITSKRYGASSAFTLTSDTAASSSSSGITGGAATSGKDIVGTINGEQATGNGQYLIGNTGNKTTEGLQVLYTGSTTGDAGTVAFSAGAANNIDLTVNDWLDSVSGLLTSQDKSIATQITNIGSQITDLTAQMNTKANDLRTRFTAMESAMSALQAQGNALNQLLGTTSSSSSSTGSSSSGLSASSSG